MKKNDFRISEVPRGPAKDPLKTHRVTDDGEVGRVNSDFSSKRVTYE